MASVCGGDRQPDGGPAPMIGDAVLPALSPHFGPFAGRTWLNCAHQGPLPAPAHAAALEAIAAKVSPAAIRDEDFVETPARLRRALARLIGAQVDDVLLANSTSYTINLVAHGLRWRAGDEVVVVAGDFPATVVPWLPLKRHGVSVRLIGSGDGRLDAETLAAALTPRTRLVCASWAFSFFGHALDLESIGRVCREHDVWFMVNGSQAIGARPIDVTALPIDALACSGFKWLCGPYATGFGWLSDALRTELDYVQPHWLRAQSAQNLNRSLDYSLPDDDTAGAFDVFCNANFFNFAPWCAAVELLLDIGVERIAAHDQALVELLVQGIDDAGYVLGSPREGPERTTLVFISHPDAARNRSVWEELERAGIDVALREERIRISPHLFNSGVDIAQTLEVLKSLS
jgi:cysteine desulfurase / selenocysteine lyase